MLSDKSQIKVEETATISAAFDNNGNVIGPALTVTPLGVAAFRQDADGSSAWYRSHHSVAGPLTGTLDVRVIATEGLKVTLDNGTVARRQRVLHRDGRYVSVSWTVNGFAGGNATYGTIDVEGFTGSGGRTNPVDV